MIHFEEITFEARQTFLQFPSTERSNYDVCDQTFHWELRHQRENMTSAGCSVHTEMPQRLLSILQFHRVHLNCPLQKFRFEKVEKDYACDKEGQSLIGMCRIINYTRILAWMWDN